MDELEERNEKTVPGPRIVRDARPLKNQLMKQNERRKAMNQTSILKTAWTNVVHYRALWLFGILLALATFSAGSALTWTPDRDSDLPHRGVSVQRRDDETLWEAIDRTYQAEIDRANRELDQLFAELNIGIRSDIVAFFYTLLGISLSLYLARLVFRYLSRTALIRMVDQHQETGQKATVRQGFRLGWSRQTWQLYFIELLVNLVVIAAGLLLFALIFGPLPLWVGGGEGAIFTFSILTAGLFFLGIFLVIVACVLAKLVKLFARRACVLEKTGVTASIHQACSLVRQNLKEMMPLVMVMVGLDLSWPFLAGVLLILLFGVGVIMGGLPGLLTGNLLTLLSTGATPVVVGAVLGGLILVAVLVAPLVWLDGMRQVFLSSMWTLTYRQLRQREADLREISPERPTTEPAPFPQGAAGLAR